MLTAPPFVPTVGSEPEMFRPVSDQSSLRATRRAFLGAEASDDLGRGPPASATGAHSLPLLVAGPFHVNTIQRHRRDAHFGAGQAGVSLTPFLGHGFLGPTKAFRMHRQASCTGTRIKTHQ